MRINKKHILLFSVIAVLFFVITDSCKKDPPLPHNPYDDINYGTGNTSTPPDPNSIVGIHKNILFPRCAKSGCHDGHFEPDYRTVESSFATLVYHKVKKNSPDSAFTFRVVPYNKTKSVLYERLTNCCFVNQDDRMPQDIIGVPLQQNLIDNISNWIMNGAKDMFGNVPVYPNTSPKILYYYATNPTYTLNYSADTNRKDSVYYNPFYVPNSSTLTLIFFVSDDSTSIANMQVNKLKISTKADDFSAATSYTGTYVNTGPPKNLEFHLVNINTATLPNSDTLFMRYFVNDGDHPTDTQFPTNNLVLPYKTYWSFIVKP
jgi:hypothetical protein